MNCKRGEQMSRGKYLSLEEARRRGEMTRFCKEHPSTGDADKFWRLLDAMIHGEPPETTRPKRKILRSSKGGAEA